MAKASPHLRVKKFCLSLPEATLELKWESVYFCVNGPLAGASGI